MVADTQQGYNCEDNYRMVRQHKSKGAMYMPTYEFKCKDCEMEFSKMTAISKKKDIYCPNCGSKNLSEKFGGIFVTGGSKGSGAHCDISQPTFG